MLSFEIRQESIRESISSMSKFVKHKEEKFNSKKIDLKDIRMDRRQLDLAVELINTFGNEMPDRTKVSKVWENFKKYFVYNENRTEGLLINKDKVGEIVADLRLNKQESKYCNVDVELQVLQEIINLYKQKVHDLSKDGEYILNDKYKIHALQDTLQLYKDELMGSIRSKNPIGNLEDALIYLKRELSEVIDMEEIERSLGFGKKKSNPSKQDEIRNKIRKLISLNEIEKSYNQYKLNNEKFEVDTFVNSLKNEIHEIEEIIQITGHSSVYDYILSNETKEISAFSILHLHKLLYQYSPDSEYGGKFKNVNNYIEGAKIETADVSEVFQRLDSLDEQVHSLLKDKESLTNCEYLERAARIHYEIVIIHPFSDGNGRVSRAFLNWLLKEKGLPPVYIKSDKKAYYFKALEEAYLSEKAIRNGDVEKGSINNSFNDLNQFFYRALLQSIMQLNNLI